MLLRRQLLKRNLFELVSPALLKILKAPQDALVQLGVAQGLVLGEQLLVLSLGDGDGLLLTGGNFHDALALTL